MGIVSEVRARGPGEDRNGRREEAREPGGKARRPGRRDFRGPEAGPAVAHVPDPPRRAPEREASEKRPGVARSPRAARPPGRPGEHGRRERQRDRRDPQAEPAHETEGRGRARDRTPAGVRLVRRERAPESGEREERDGRVGPVRREDLVREKERRQGEVGRRDGRGARAEEAEGERGGSRGEDRVEDAHDAAEHRHRGAEDRERRREDVRLERAAVRRAPAEDGMPAPLRDEAAHEPDDRLVAAEGNPARRDQPGEERRSGERGGPKRQGTPRRSLGRACGPAVRSRRGRDGGNRVVTGSNRSHPGRRAPGPCPGPCRTRPRGPERRPCRAGRSRRSRWPAHPR